MNTNVATDLKTLRLTRKAFTNVKGTSKHKIETRAYAFEQIKPILKEYMEENHILKLEVNLKRKTAVALEPILNGERDLWIRLWLNGEVSTKQLRKRMKQHFQWVQYLSFNDFLESMKYWLREKAGDVQND